MAKFFEKSSKFMKFWPKMLKNRGTPLFSLKNKCVLNDSIWTETHFGTFFVTTLKGKSLKKNLTNG